MSDTTIQDLIEAAELVDVFTIEVAARRAESPEGAESGPVHPKHDLELQFRDDGGAIRVILKTEIDVEHVGWIRVQQAIEYTTGEIHIDDLEIEVMEAFVNDVAIMALLPFVREAIADITLKVFGSGLLMPVMARGRVHFSLESSEDPAIDDATGH